MAQITTISLRIYAGAQSLGLNKEPIVSVGNAPDDFSPLPPTLVDEQKVWMITHAQTYTLYSMFSKAFNTSDGQPGQLLVCLFLPAQQRLADGNSPLGLLNSIMDNFAIQALRDNVLPAQAIDSSSFAVLTKRYRLEQRPMLLPIMQGHEPASLCVENASRLDALMRHSRYPVLGGVARLELGMHCKSTIVLGGKPASPARPIADEPVSPSRETQRPVANPSQQKETPVSPLRQEPRRAERPKPAAEPSHTSNFTSPGSNQGGGVSLGDDFENSGKSSNGKKILFGIIGVAAVALIAFLLFGLGGKDTSADEPLIAEAENVVAADEVGENQPTTGVEIDEEAARKALEEEEARKAAEEAEAKQKADEEAEAKKKAEEAEAKKKAEEEAKRKAAAEEARRKAQEQQNAQWKSNIQQLANGLPEQIRIGAFVRKLTVNGNTVTCTINYEELSMYDLSSSERENLANDRTTVRNKYGKNLPSNVSFVVVQLDRAGRSIK